MQGVGASESLRPRADGVGPRAKLSAARRRTKEPRAAAAEEATAAPAPAPAPAVEVSSPGSAVSLETGARRGSSTASETAGREIVSARSAASGRWEREPRAGALPRSGRTACRSACGRPAEPEAGRGEAGAGEADCPAGAGSGRPCGAGWAAGRTVAPALTAVCCICATGRSVVWRTCFTTGAAVRVAVSVTAATPGLDSRYGLRRRGCLRSSGGPDQPRRRGREGKPDSQVLA